jgi:hypothetical protein
MELEDLLLNTQATTFEGAKVQLQTLHLGIEDGRDIEDLNGALLNLRNFISEIEHALERHGLKGQAQRWCWEKRVPSAPVWKDHPGKPADAEEIWSAALPPARGEATT